jgi:hypothetical protein
VRSLNRRIFKTRPSNSRIKENDKFDYIYFNFFPQQIIYRHYFQISDSPREGICNVYKIPQVSIFNVFINCLKITWIKIGHSTEKKNIGLSHSRNCEC